MTKKELVSKVAAETGYSESHVSKVLSGSRFNQDISDVAEKFEKEDGAVLTSNPSASKLAVVKKETSTSKLSDFTDSKEVKRLRPDEIGNLLKQVREHRGISQDTLASHMGVSRSTISAIETDSANCKLQYFFDWFVACSCIVDIRLSWV